MFTKLCPPQHFLRSVLFYVLYLRENLTSQETLGNTSWLRVGSGGGGCSYLGDQGVCSII